MTIIDGKKISEDILNEISLEVEQRTNKGYKTPHLAAILVGDDGPSQTYVNSKINACKEVGFKSSLFKYDNNITINSNNISSIVMFRTEIVLNTCPENFLMDFERSRFCRINNNEFPFKAVLIEID